MDNEWRRCRCFFQVFLMNRWSINCQRILIIIHFTLSIIHFSSAQTPTNEQLTGIWIGVHSEWDTDFFCPLPTYLQLDADGTYHLGMVDNLAQELTSTWAVHGDSFRLDTIHFAPRMVSLHHDLLRIGTNYPMVFRRFNPIPIDSASTYQQVNGRVWQSGSLIISLYTNGQASLENSATKQRTAHFWRLAQFGKSVFLVIRGNQYNRDSGYKPLWQISSLLPKQMQAIGWNGRAVATETFRFVRNLAPGDSCRPSGFQTCDNCFVRVWHETFLTRSSKRYELTQLFAKYYRPINQAGQSGLLITQFVVNCEGQCGLIEINGFSDDYCPKLFDTQITNQLVSICHNHVASHSFLQADNERDTHSGDIAVSLTFKLKDGQLTDILP